MDFDAQYEDNADGETFDHGYSYGADGAGANNDIDDFDFL
jgi:hypothetical protein